MNADVKTSENMRLVERNAKEATLLLWLAVDKAELLTGLTHCWRVDDRHQLLDVVADDTIEELLVTILHDLSYCI